MIAAAPARSGVLSAQITSPREWGIIILVAVLFAFIPQLPDNDWFRNASDLPDALAIYKNPAYVYPPWALILFAPYYLIGAAGARVASVLVVGVLGQRSGWALKDFLAVVISPLFMWTMVLSSADILILLIPILLWSIVGRGESLRRGLALAILLLKPQVGLVLALPRLWSLRREPRRLLTLLVIAGAIMLPVSLIGSPPLLVQWLNNLGAPQVDNIGFWQSNNLSMTVSIGFIPALLLVTAVFGGVYLWIRSRQRRWTDRHTDSTLLAASMLLAPYASNQSAIVPLALHPSWRVTVAQWFGVMGAALLNRYAQLDEWLVLVLVALALLLSNRARGNDSIMPERVAGEN